jgi:hypothetical protein
MTQRTKTLGLALFALLALGAMSATTASAQEKQFHSEGTNTVVTGEDTAGTQSRFVTPHNEIKCANNLYEGSQAAATASELTITQTVSNCTDEVGRTVVVDFNGCDYKFTLEPGQTETAGGTTHTSGPVHIACEGANVIKLTVKEFGFTVCTVDIPAQTPTVPTVDYTNQGSGSTRDVHVVSTIEGIQYEETGGLCPTDGAPHHDAIFRAEVTVKGYGAVGAAHGHNSTQRGIWVE